MEEETNKTETPVLFSEESFAIYGAYDVCDICHKSKKCLVVRAKVLRHIYQVTPICYSCIKSFEKRPH